MLTRHEAERLAASIHAIRPEWPVGSLLTFIKRHETKPLLDLSLGLMWVALLPDTKTPARVDEQGPWKYVVTNSAIAPSVRYAEPDDCGICSGAKDGPHADHHYQQRLPNTEWARPTPEQKELMRLAAEQAHLDKTAAADPANEPQPEGTPT